MHLTKYSLPCMKVRPVALAICINLASENKTVVPQRIMPRIVVIEV